MTIRKILQNIFKSFFQILFKILYGKIIISKDINKINLKKIKVNNIYINKKKYNLDNNIYKVSNGRIFTDLEENVAIIKDNFIIPEISYQQVNGELKKVNYNSVVYKGTNRILKTRNGKIFCLAQGGSGNN